MTRRCEWVKFSRRARRSLLKGVTEFEGRLPRLPTEVLVPLYYLVSRSIVLIESARPNFASSIFRISVRECENASVTYVATPSLAPVLLVPFSFRIFPDDSHNLCDKYTVDNLRICCVSDDSRCFVWGGVKWNESQWCINVIWLRNVASNKRDAHLPLNV